jgi:hypothetical protein
MPNIAKGDASSAVRLKEGAAPATPPSGYADLYVDSTGKPHAKTDGGIVYDLTGTGSAPSTPEYVIRVASASLANAQVLSTLPTGAMQVATGSGAVSSLKSNLLASTDPGPGDDSADGYGPGSVWVNLTGDRAFMCADNTAGAAIWKQVGVGAPNGTPDMAACVAPPTTGWSWLNQGGLTIDERSTHLHLYAPSGANRATDIRGRVRTAGVSEPWTLTAAVRIWSHGSDEGRSFVLFIRSSTSGRIDAFQLNIESASTSIHEWIDETTVGTTEASFPVPILNPQHPHAIYMRLRCVSGELFGAYSYDGIDWGDETPAYPILATGYNQFGFGYLEDGSGETIDGRTDINLISWSVT